jgi:hypothetical protein
VRLDEASRRRPTFVVLASRRVRRIFLTGDFGFFSGQFSKRLWTRAMSVGMPSCCSTGVQNCPRN